MIITVNISTLELSKQKKSFVWLKPLTCPNCSSCSIWGHGFVFTNGLFFKRYRCNDCLSVITLKPADFWKHYKTSVEDIYIEIRHRLSFHNATCHRAATRSQHWLSKFTKFIIMLYGMTDADKNILEKLDHLYLKNIKFLV